MAEMLSTKVPTSQPAEHRVYEALKRADHTRNWKVFYSIHVPQSRGEAREIDFLVLIPEYHCIICLEVKGGSYKIEDGKWYASYSSKPLQESPHDQVRKSMFALKNNFFQKGFRYFERGYPLSIGCAVVFTDADKPDSSLPDHLAYSIWSSDDLRNKLQGIADKTSSKRRPKVDEKKKKRVAQEYLKDLEDNLMESDMSITKNRIFSSDLDTLREKLLVLTSEQFHSLDLVKDNDCCVIKGAAGTGKTILAMELARQRCEENGEKVALICSNPYLNSRFVRWAQTLLNENGGNVVPGTLEDFSTFDSPEQEKFDYLIVDEAQNLCDEESRNLMDRLLKKGLTNGDWAMFGDFDYQNIINPELHENGKDVLNNLKELYPRMTLGRLKINCRNTYEIAAAASMFLGIDSLPRSGVHGPLIQTKYFKTQEQLNNLLDELVTDFKDREFYSRQIILLSSSSDDFKTEPPLTYGGWRLLNVLENEGRRDLDREDVLDISGDSSPGNLRYSDIHDFQGLESEVVILVIPLTEQQTEVGNVAILPQYDYLQRVLYTGMSRAKAILIIVAHESYEKHLDLEPRFRNSYEDRVKLMVEQSSESGF